MKIKLLKLQASVVYGLYHFFYTICNKLAEKHNKIYKKACEIKGEK